MHQIDHGGHGSGGGASGYRTRAEEYCPCLTNPAASQSLIMLAQQLQSVSSMLRSLPEHRNGELQCLIMRRIQEVNDLLQYVLPSLRSIAIILTRVLLS